MGKTRGPTSKKAACRKGADGREARGAPAIYHKTSAAGTRVFASDQLTKLILRYVPYGVLLSRSQCVCRRWQEVTREILRPLLDHVLESARPSHRRREVNPLLLEHFGRIFDSGAMQLNVGLWLTGQHYSRMRSLIDLPMATPGPGRVVHDAYARVGASWRSMQIYDPPIYALRYRREEEVEVQTVAAAEGLRLGQVYDILVAVTSNTKGFAWNEVLLTWPQSGPEADMEGDDSDSDGGRDEEGEGLRDYILVERRQHILPKFCDCAHAPSSNERCFCGFGGNKHKLQLIASNKWRVTSKEFKEEKLMVTI